jgi:hypothetical protein
MPVMPRKIKVWNGSPERNGICRMSTDDLAQKINAISFILKSSHKGTKSIVCIDATDEQFKQYASLTFTDLGVLHGYIETLIYSCKEWKTK